MKKVQEYKILPQADQHERGGGGSYPGDEYPYSSKTNCIGSFLIALTAIFILIGSAGLIVTAFWSKEFHSTLDEYWPSHPIGGSHSQAIWLEQNGTNSTTLSPHGSHNSTEYPINYHTNGTKHNGTSGEESSSSEEVGHHSNGTAHGHGKNGTDIDIDMEINETNIGRKFAEAMRNFEKQMEKISGIHQAELVIPLFMLVTFMSTLALISFCCCLMSKRREQRQRKLLGKIITDLQGPSDSKTILLGSRDEDF